MVDYTDEQIDDKDAATLASALTGAAEATQAACTHPLTSETSAIAGGDAGETTTRACATCGKVLGTDPA